MAHNIFTSLYVICITQSQTIKLSEILTVIKICLIHFAVTTILLNY